MKNLPKQETVTLWPCPKIEQNLAREQSETDYIAPWVEIGDEEYWWFLECVPPLMLDHRGYVNSEPYSSTPDGQDIYVGVIEVKGKFYAKMVTLAEYTHLNLSQVSLQPRVLTNA
ncbi:MAG: hypothetical protein HC851_21600 [Acaryochloris sp. RU_4_1]|nr:hypothetical protein [Acaryochloris sp. RU_4_1]NJR57343.1 hypothetical protein [Acaryochloris sp. CRU_2_0]